MINALSLRVILVDDDPDDRRLIRWALDTGLESVAVDEMTTGQELIDWLANKRKLMADSSPVDEPLVTVIVLDMHMPKLTGLETLQLLGDMSDLPYMPVVMLTGSMSDQLKQQAYQQGIHLFMLKPSGPSGFYRVVEAIKLCYRDTLRLRERQQLADHHH